MFSNGGNFWNTNVINDLDTNFVLQPSLASFKFWVVLDHQVLMCFFIEIWLLRTSSDRDLRRHMNQLNVLFKMKVCKSRLPALLSPERSLGFRTGHHEFRCCPTQMNWRFFFAFDVDGKLCSHHSRLKLNFNCWTISWTTAWKFLWFFSKFQWLFRDRFINQLVLLVRDANFASFQIFRCLTAVDEFSGRFMERWLLVTDYSIDTVAMSYSLYDSHSDKL